METGPDRAIHGVVRWRQVDLQKVIKERFGVSYYERTICKLLKHLGFNIWQYLRSNYLSNRVFETYEDIIEAECQAWKRLIENPTPSTPSGCEHGHMPVKGEAHWYYY